MQARNRPTRLSSPVFVKAGALSPQALYRRGRFIAAGALSPRVLPVYNSAAGLKPTKLRITLWNSIHSRPS